MNKILWWVFVGFAFAQFLASVYLLASILDMLNLLALFYLLYVTKPFEVRSVKK